MENWQNIENVWMVTIETIIIIREIMYFILNNSFKYFTK